MSLGDKGGETHSNSIKELCKCTDFPRPPKAMEEELEHPLLGVGKPLVLTPIAMEDHRSKRKPLEDLGAWGVEQERDLCDSGTQRPGLLEGIPSEQSHANTLGLGSSFTFGHHLCAICFIHPHLPGCMTVVSFSSHPRALLGSKKGDQVQLRDSKTCLFKKKKKEHITHPGVSTISNPVVFNSGEGSGIPLQCSCLGSQGWRSLVGCSPWGR